MAFRSPAPPGRLIDVGGFKLHLNCAGEGSPTVVLDAALGGSSISWSLVQPDLARETRVCSYDRAGFGWSDAGPMPRTAGRIAGELRVLLDRGQVSPPFVLVGHSFGALVVRIFAARYPSDTAALVLVDPPPPEDWVTPAPKEQLKITRGRQLCRHGTAAARIGVARVVGFLAELGAINMARGMAKIVSRGRLSREDEGILAPIWRLPQDARRPLRYFWTQEKFYAALGSQIECISISAAETLEASAGGYGDLPLVTLSSTDPDQHKVERQEALARLSTRGRHIVASNSGHWIPLDQPGVVIGVIRDVLTESRGLSAGR
jgi:pimeloyl-ACP methyl ester carboxylesterase